MEKALGDVLRNFRNYSNRAYNHSVDQGGQVRGWFTTSRCYQEMRNINTRDHTPLHQRVVAGAARFFAPSLPQLKATANTAKAAARKQVRESTEYHEAQQ